MVAKIYQVASDPYTNDEDQSWAMDILWVDDEEGTMGAGSIHLPFDHTAEDFKRYFRQNVTPLDPEQVQKIIEESIKGKRQ